MRPLDPDGAQGGRTAEDWSDPESTAWSILDGRLAAAGLTPAQLQCVWIKLALGHPFHFGGFPAHAEELRDRLADVVRIAKASPAPWLGWRPYLRTDGETPRSDGFRWLCSDLDPEDFTHPSNEGMVAIAALLLDLVHTEPTVAWCWPHPYCGRLGAEPAAALIGALVVRRGRRGRVRRR